MIGTVLYLVQLVTFAFGLMCLLRFLAQLMYVDPTNAIVKLLVKITDPLLQPIRAIMPRSAKTDVASGLIAWISFGVSEAISNMLIGGSFSILKSIIVSFALVLQTLVWIFFAAIIASAVMSWFSTNARHPALLLAQQISARLTNPIRRLLPALGPMDFSPAVVLILLMFLNNLLIGPLRQFGLGMG